MHAFKTIFVSLHVVVATVADIPSINREKTLPTNALPVSYTHNKFQAPVPYVPFTQGAKSTPSDFVHPGLWHSHEDLETIRKNVLDKVDPWSSAYSIFANDTYSKSSYQMKGPFPVISRGSTSNYTSFTHDARAAYQNAIMWYITKDQEHWNRSTTILDGWGSTLTNIIGTDRSLMIGLDGDLFVNAAEIMRWEGGWVEQGAKWQGGSGFSIQLYWLFAKQSIVIGQANYGIASIKGLLSFAIYLEDVAMYNYALWMYKNDPCAGIKSTIHSRTGQNSESGRDQAHAMVGLGWLGLAARTVKNQGYDLYRYENDLLLKGTEYTAKYNLNETVTYDEKFRRCEAVLVNGPWKNISIDKRGIGEFSATGAKSQAVWDLLHYSAVAYGLKNPWTVKAKIANSAVKGEEGLTGNDMPGWGDLLFAVKSKK